MVNQVVIVHGWSDTSKSFEPLADFLSKSGRVAIPLWLGDYISMDDDVQIPDVAKRLEAVIQSIAAPNGPLKIPFDMIVHSTGGLVAREWLNTYYAKPQKKPPVQRLLMLAPANHGSKLASMGQSLLGRVVKGWNNWFHTGKEMLNALELSSPYQWDLAQRDMLVSEEQSAPSSIFGENGVWPFVIIGTHPYPSLLRQIVNENGGDGTVRVPAGNLNCKGLTLDFSKDEADPDIKEWKSRVTQVIPLAVLPMRTHSSIILPEGGDVPEETPEQKADLGRLIIDALNCSSAADYSTIQTDWFKLSEQTASIQDDQHHQYLMVNVLVVDDYGTPVPDYFLEFSGPSADRSDDATVYFHTSVLEDVHVNSHGGERRCFFIDRTDLLTNFYAKIRVGDKVLTMSLSANPPGDNIRYFDSTKVGAKGSFKLHDKEVESERWLKRNTTHYLKIVIPRRPIDNVFKVRSY